MSHAGSEAEQTLLAVATLFACTVRTLAASGQISEDDWAANVMTAYNELRERGGQNLHAMQGLSWSIQALEELRKR